MKRKAGLILSLAVVLGCSACGAARVVTVTQMVSAKHAAPDTNRLPIRRTGVGSESFGTFAMHGWLYVKATCVGTGKFSVYFNKNGGSAACKGSATLKWASNFAVNVHRAQISVRAPAGMKWSVIVFEGPTDRSRATNVW